MSDDRTTDDVVNSTPAQLDQDYEEDHTMNAMTAYAIDLFRAAERARRRVEKKDEELHDFLARHRDAIDFDVYATVTEEQAQR